MKKINIHYAYGDLEEFSVTIPFEVDENLSSEEIEKIAREEIINGLQVKYSDVDDSGKERLADRKSGMK